MYSFRAPVFHPPSTTERRLVDTGPPLLEKIDGIADALGEAGLSIADMPIVETCGTREEAEAFGSGIATMLDMAPEATAVIALTDSIAISVLREAQQRGIDVPRDLSVVGFDDGPDAALSEPPLTTVHVSAVENGRAAAQLLLNGGAAAAGDHAGASRRSRHDRPASCIVVSHDAYDGKQGQGRTECLHRYKKFLDMLLFLLNSSLHRYSISKTKLIFKLALSNRPIRRSRA